jgi:hypothetical protein
MCVSNITLPYSFYNVSSYYNNRTFSLIFPKGSTTQTISVTLQEGFYTVTDINSYIQQTCIANGAYLIDSTGNYVYYQRLVYNSTYYAVQLLLYSVPTTLPICYTRSTTGIYSGGNIEKFTYINPLQGATSPRSPASPSSVIDFSNTNPLRKGAAGADSRMADASVFNTTSPRGKVSPRGVAPAISLNMPIPRRSSAAVSSSTNVAADNAGLSKEATSTLEKQNLEPIDLEDGTQDKNVVFQF